MTWWPGRCSTNRRATCVTAFTAVRVPGGSGPKTASGGGVEGRVDERVGGGVLSPRNGADAPAVKGLKRPARLEVQLAHGRVLDLVFAVELLGHELGVADEIDLGGPERASALEPAQDGAIFGHVVRGQADRLGHLLEHVALAVGDDDPDGRRTGIAPRAPVDVDEQLHRGEPVTRRPPRWRARA